MEPTESLVPEPFGPLQGVHILSTGSLIACPFGAHLAAEMGAEVIQVEQPGEGDFWRQIEFPVTGPGGIRVGSGWIQERRNAFYITLNMTTRKGRDIFLQLVKRTDIWMDASKPRTYEKWGLDDKTVLAANPQLIIVHLSGFGQDGHPDYSNLGGYDPIALAFGGMMGLTGYPDPDPPVRASPWTGDYLSALFCLCSGLAGYIFAKHTGKGQSIDVAQYQIIHKCLAGTMVAYFQDGLIRERGGNRAGLVQPNDLFHARDGWIFICASGLPMFDRVCRAVGLEKDKEYKKAAHMGPGSQPWEEFDVLMRCWVADRTMADVEKDLKKYGVPCSRALNAKDMAENEQYQAQEVHIEWDDLQVGRVKGVGITPRFLGTPGRIWRGSVPVGYDNATVYGQALGLTQTEIANLKQQEVI